MASLKAPRTLLVLLMSPALILVVVSLLVIPADAFPIVAPKFSSNPSSTAQRQTHYCSPHACSPRLVIRTHQLPMAASSSNDDETNKFSLGQRLESIKCVVVGALSGGIAVTPLTALHDIALGGGQEGIHNGVAQWEFDTDMGSLEAALFCIVYRYCVRKDENPMLNQGVIGAFVLTRTLSRIRVPSYCHAAPLDCGPPLGYFDWSMAQQGVLSGIESVALFGAAAVAMEYCFRKGYISRFPG